MSSTCVEYKATVLRYNMYEKRVLIVEEAYHEIETRKEEQPISSVAVVSAKSTAKSLFFSPTVVTHSALKRGEKTKLPDDESL